MLWIEAGSLSQAATQKLKNGRYAGSWSRQMQTQEQGRMAGRMMELQPEQQLLICIARKELGERITERLQELVKSQLEWKYVFRAATHHGLLPLLHHHLNSTCPDLVPPAVLNDLRTESERNNVRNLSLVRELLNLNRIFQAHNVESLNLKGPLLGEKLYGGLGLRTVGDLDLLIRRADFPEAHEALQQAGYVMEPQLSPAQLSRHLRFHCEIQFFHPQLDCVIDLHWALAPQNFSGSLRTDDVFARKQETWIGGRAIDTLSDEDLLLFLCMHAAKHYWSRLEWLAAIAELMGRTDEMDCSLLLSRAEATAGETMLLLTSEVARKLFEVELPHEINRAISDDAELKSKSALIVSQLFREEAEALDPWQMFRMNLLVMDRKHSAVAALLRSILTPTISDWRSLNVPGALYPIYYLFRPIRLTGKYLLKVARFKRENIKPPVKSDARIPRTNLTIT